MQIKAKISTAIALGSVLGMGYAASADTIITDLGVHVDGIVTETPEGLYKVVAGENTVFYRKEEVVSIEKNNKTGALDLEAIAAEAKRVDEEMTAKTGLTAAQRATVDALMPSLMQVGEAGHIQARDSLIKMQAECDVFAYLQMLWEGGVPAIQVAVYDVLIRIDRARTMPILRDGLSNLSADVRAKAIEMLGQLESAEDATEVVRGLVDPEFRVRIAAAYALANLRFRAATPALIQCLPHPDLRVSNSARESLGALWADVIADPKPQTVDEWNAVWEANKGTNNAIALDGLEPLTDPAVPFVAG